QGSDGGDVSAQRREVYFGARGPDEQIQRPVPRLLGQAQLWTVSTLRIGRVVAMSPAGRAWGFGASPVCHRSSFPTTFCQSVSQVVLPPRPARAYLGRIHTSGQFWSGSRWRRTRSEERSTHSARAATCSWPTPSSPWSARRLRGCGAILVAEITPSVPHPPAPGRLRSRAQATKGW